MATPQFIGPLYTEAFRNRGSRNMSAAELRRLERENSPDVQSIGPDGMASDQGAATARIAAMERRVAEIDAMEARSKAKKGQGTRTRGLSAKLRDERDRTNEALAGLRTGREKASEKRARITRANEARKAKNAGKKAGGNVVAGGTKRGAKTDNPAPKKPRAPRTQAQKEARNARERAARAAKKAGG